MSGWMSGNTLRNRIRERCILKKLDVTPIEDKISENWDGLWMCNGGLMGTH